MDIAQEYEKLCAKFIQGHKGLWINHEKCPCRSTTAMCTEWGGWRGRSRAGKWKRPPRPRGVGGGWLEDAFKINRVDERGIFSTFLYLSILPLLSCPGTLIKNTEFMVDELRLQQKTPGRHLYSELKPASFNYKAMQPNTLLNSHWNHPNWVTWVPSCRQAILEYQTDPPDSFSQ